MPEAQVWDAGGDQVTVRARLGLPHIRSETTDLRRLGLLVVSLTSYHAGRDSQQFRTGEGDGSTLSVTIHGDGSGLLSYTGARPIGHSTATAVDGHLSWTCRSDAPVRSSTIEAIGRARSTIESTLDQGTMGHATVTVRVDSGNAGAELGGIVGPSRSVSVGADIVNPGGSGGPTIIEVTSPADRAGTRIDATLHDVALKRSGQPAVSIPDAVDAPILGDFTLQDLSASADLSVLGEERESGKVVEHLRETFDASAVPDYLSVVAPSGQRVGADAIHVDAATFDLYITKTAGQLRRVVRHLSLTIDGGRLLIDLGMSPTPGGTARIDDTGEMTLEPLAESARVSPLVPEVGSEGPVHDLLAVLGAAV